MDAIENKEGATLASLLCVTASDNRQRISQAFRANPRVSLPADFTSDLRITTSKIVPPRSITNHEVKLQNSTLFSISGGTSNKLSA